MSFADELRSRNFSIYGQCVLHYPRTTLGVPLGGSGLKIRRAPIWLGVLCILLGIALGIANIFHFSLLIIFSVILLCSAIILIFVEIPLLLRLCPTSAKFDAFIRSITTNYMRAGMYLVMSIVQWLSIIIDPSSLIAAAVVYLLAALCYALAGLKKQEFVGSKTLGGQGVAQMIV